MKHRWGLTILIAFVLNSLSILGIASESKKGASIQGIVVSESGEPIGFAALLVQELNKGTTSTHNGRFEIKNIETGTYKLRVQCLGFTTLEQQIEVIAGTNNLPPIILAPNMFEVDEVFVAGKSKVAETRRLAYAISSIDAKPLQNLNQDINLVLGKVTGVRVREEGGLGSDFSFSLNGFSGRQVKFFIDGIPMDNFGSSLGLNNIPINMAERIEVYKGVVPVHLGSDALGGAVNIVTKTDVRSFLDVSYGAGSFNTHRLSVLSRYVNPNTGFTVGMNALSNYSDNNYWVDVEIYDVVTKAFKGIESVRRFNDSYKAAMFQTELGWMNKPFADQFLLSFITSGNYKEVQNGVNMTQVAGQVYRTNQQNMGSLKYKKENLLLPHLNASFYGSYLNSNSLVADSSSRQYNWYGDYSVKTIGTSGELSYNRTLFNFNDRSALASTNIGYEPFPNHSFVINHNYTWFRRVGSDPLSPYTIPFEKPNIMHKHVLGTGYKNQLFNERLSTNVFYKLFLMNIKVMDASWGESTESQKSFQRQSFGAASTYFITREFQLKASYENTYRLPEVYELMGDGFLLENNPDLKPESSNNLNVGLLWNRMNKRHHVTIETNYLYRLASDLIHIDVAAMTSQYQNLRSVGVNSLEANIRYGYKKRFIIELNSTYMNMENLDATTGYYKVRIPNAPYLFGNLATGVSIDNAFHPLSKVNLNWSVLYVESFYLRWPNLGLPASKYTIPTQFSHDVSATWSWGERYNISAECRNLFNKNLYDNYALQKPGRSFNVKLRYFISK